MTKKLTCALIAVALGGLSFSYSWAQSRRSTRRQLFARVKRLRFSSPPGRNNYRFRGAATIVVRNFNEDQGTDLGEFAFRGLNPNATYTLWQTHAKAIGALPACLVALFTTDENGFGRVTVQLRMFNAFYPINPSLIASDGTTKIVGAGAVANGAKAVPLIYFRVYSITPGSITSIFGKDALNPGGGIVGVSDPAFGSRRIVRFGQRLNGDSSTSSSNSRSRRR